MPVLSKIGSAFADAFSAVLDAISNGIMNFDFNKVFDLLNTGIFSSILLSIAGFAKGLNKAGDKLSFDGIFDKFKEFIDNSPIGSVKKILDDTREAIGAWTTNIQSKTLRNIAVSIAILAASLIALSLVDSKKLEQTEKQYGKICERAVIYNGENSNQDCIKYLNAEEYLLHMR